MNLKKQNKKSGSSSYTSTNQISMVTKTQVRKYTLASSVVPCVQAYMNELVTKCRGAVYSSVTTVSIY